MSKQDLHSVAVLGSGESGMGAVRLAVKQGLSVFLSDGSAIAEAKKDELTKLGVAFEEGGHSLDKIVAYKEVVKSPGIPNSAAIIKEIKAASVPVISEIEFASRYTGAKLIGITGSNGKTTTTLLTTHILKSAGLNAASAGNVGNSLSDLLASGAAHDIIVLELSSFQLDDIDTFKPDVAVLLNITPDHLDRYNYQMAEYAAAKYRLFENMGESDLIILNQDDSWVVKGAQSSPARIQPVSVQGRVLGHGAFSEADCLILDTEKEIEVIPTGYLPLIGKHNHYNQMAAILAALEVGVSFPEIINALGSFKNAAHRLENAGVVNDITFINDSKATNVDAVFYALDAIEAPIVWIAGGVNKGNDYSQIKALVQQKVHTLICMGKDNAHLKDEFSGDVSVLTETLSAAEAVKAAFEHAQEGDVVLLSPACASFDLFKNYEDRGDQFKAAVKELKDVQPKMKQI
ncbi:UDP-N-acetylmuramoyl-L-alanine--D-glutamate ligase [Reichenbachiella ulvae]|uniref:UDP-N-acetylmuramoylalanine--D-glutamate ligase n=1 Tax=Reichenbachiella ulvae TaxID=2980104 RepID=A0ABT3CUD0_9BACT|nr:UDP-N-acetylmuramoyl-L-alanine--D-glutamate ligase [Reichenbachiella ulvae]MCV9387129.1 UDP-N-acetylmuramoyl-L-alanine--D-glutamate ligase [Reichenbachiella ulvae]